MYSNFFVSEFKNWLRDPMMRFMVFYPLLFGFIGRYLLPLLEETSGFSLEFFGDYALAALTLMTPMVYGAVIGFSILDDRDDHILNSIKVTPLSIHQFLSFRLIMGFLFSMASCVFVMWFSDIGELAWRDILGVSFLASWSVPLTGLLINAYSKNKIEGFAVMKGMGTLLLIPIVSLYFTDAVELFFGIVPPFWPAKVISSVLNPEGRTYLSYQQYYVFGLAYVLILNVLVYRFFLRRVET